jgi:hypothetical protein
MAALVAAIPVFVAAKQDVMAGTRPAMTNAPN